MKQLFFFSSIILFVGIGVWLVLTSKDSTPFTFLQTQTRMAPEIKEMPREPLTLLFGGDMMLDRYIRTVAKRKGEDFLLAPLQKLLHSGDVVIANLEGPITDKPSVSETSVVGEAKNYVFTFPPESANFLKRNNIGIVNLGNNHSLNFGSEGVIATKQFLEAAGIRYFGSPLPHDTRYTVTEMRGLKIGFVNYNEFLYQGKEKALADIASVKPHADLVILYTHWGKEYVPALPSVKDLAHEFIEAGVDVIIGSHPHVIQEKEVYQGKTIYYSLGNFIFDQYQDRATQEGLLVRLTIDHETRALTFEDIPIFLQSTGQATLERKP